MALHNVALKYQSFIADFRKWTQTTNALVYPADNTYLGSQILMPSKLMEVTCLLHLQDWPLKAGSAKPNANLSMLVCAKELFADEQTLIKSNVVTMYFRPNKIANPAVPDVAIHYDYEHGMKAAHPLFHASFGGMHIERAKLDMVGFARDLDIAKYQPIKSIRIPTIHIGLPATLLGLVADHLDNAVFAGFLNSSRTHPFFKQIAARTDCRKFDMAQQAPTYSHSHHLYN